MEKAIFKFNSSLGAILCSSCRKIIKIGKDFTDEEWKAFRGELDYPAQYCEQCNNLLLEEHPTT